MAAIRSKTIREINNSSNNNIIHETQNSNATISDLLITSQTSSSSSLSSHLLINTSNVKQISKLYSCSECNNFSAISKVEFNRHVKTHKPQEEKYNNIIFLV